MGYRSNVTICIRGHKDEILAGLAALRLKGAKPEHLAEFQQITVGDNGLVLKYEDSDVKWYAGYSDVDGLEAVYAYFAKLANTDSPAGHELDGAFARIGEDNDDIETRNFGGEGYDLVQVERSIACRY